MEPIPTTRKSRAWILWSLQIFFVCIVSVLPTSAQKQSVTPIKIIFVIPSSHWDLGFLRPPEEQLDVIKPHIDEVIRDCEADPDFRWTIESGWQLRVWLDRTHDHALVAQLGDLLRKGQIELSAADGSMHTEFMGTEELNRLAYSPENAETEFGVHSSVAMMDDVPGFSLRLPQVLARSDVNYMMTGSNIGFGGGTSLFGKMPIYWQSPDGSKVLMWQTQGKNGGYTQAMADYYIDPDAEDPYSHIKFYPKSWSGLSKLEIMQRGVDKLLKQYEDADYQHSAIALLYMHDGIGPDYERKGLLPNVRAWNAAGKKPRIVVATPFEFFSYMRTHDGDNYPTYYGDWSGLWSAVKLNSPAMSANARWLQDRLPEAETLWSLLDGLGLSKTYPSKEIASDYWKLFQYDEHSGAGQSGWPKLMTREQVEQQNREYSNDMRTAHASVSELLHSGLTELTQVGKKQNGRPIVLIYNPLSWESTQLVKVSVGNGDFIVRDAGTNRIVKSQRLYSGDLSFEAVNVPAIGYRTYILEPVRRKSISDNKTLLQSPYYFVQVDPASGAIIRIVDKRLNRVLVDTTVGGRVGELVDSANSADGSLKNFHAIIHHYRGALLDQLVIERQGSYWPETVLTLPLTEPRLDLTEVLDRSKMSFIKLNAPSAKYSFDFKFLFHVEPQCWIDDGEGLYRFPQDLLPGARSGAAVPRHTLVWSEASGANPFSIMLAQKQSFFDEFPKNIPQLSAKSPLIRGVRIAVLSKSDQGDTKDQGVVSFSTYEPGYPSTYSFSFSLSSRAGKLDSVAAHHFGLEANSSFIPVLLPASDRPAVLTRSLFSLDAPNVVLEAIKPSRDGEPGHYMLRLQEIAGKSTEVSLHSMLPILSVDETTMTENRVLIRGLRVNALHLDPYQTLTLCLTLRHPANSSQGAIN